MPREATEVICAWCRAPLEVSASHDDPTQALRVCATCRQRRRWEWEGRRRTSARLRADSEQLEEQSRIRLARAKASVARTWARLLEGWRARWPQATGTPALGAGAPPAARPTEPPAGPGTPTRLTVLVIEDDPNIRDATKLLLEDLGARVLTAADGLGGIALLQAEAPDVVLCDLRMPRLDGLAFIRRVRQNPRWARLPVVAVSAFTGSAEQEQVREAGFDDTLSKPFDLAQLAGVVERLAHHRLAA